MLERVEPVKLKRIYSVLRIYAVPMSGERATMEFSKS